QVGSYEPLVYSDNGEPSATRYDGGAFKSMYLAFPFEWLPNVADRAELMGTVLQEWFGCELPCIGVEGVAVDGPPEVQIGQSGTFTATVEPGHANEPVEITWSNGTTATTSVYNWEEPGWHTVAVTATNCYGGAAASATYDVLVTCDAVTIATISGPTELALYEQGTFEVAVAPPTATVPVDVLWSNGATTTSTTYSFATPGVHTLAVTVTNCAGTAAVVDTFDVLVTCDGVTGATILGPAMLVVDEVGAFEVSVQPPTATLPIDVEWSNGATTTSTTYGFATPGVHTVAVTVTNCAGTVVVVEAIEVLACDVVTGATISGPADLMLYEAGAYQVAVAPPDATPPVDVVWNNGATTTSTLYTFADLGPQTVAVTVTNCAGAAVVTDTLGVTVTCAGVTGLSLSGPGELFVDEVGTYQVSVEPPAATLPIELIWSSGVTGTEAVYSWAAPGDYSVVVTVTNCLGTAVVTDTLAVHVRAARSYVYLPVVLRAGP
ncbi:MAG: hypothetical protein JXD18_00645, partial [Anaerolineae bacterium]|nr:hypothetical protein [Anaerolineae bacterium]